MARIKKKGEAGAAKNFISRNQAIKKLQVTLADFRRLCILKGVYPREPRNKKKANKGSTAPTTFYYTKDIQYLLHEPVLDKFREHKIFARKLSKALGKQDFTGAKRLEANRPRYTLDHIIKERYPTFSDAVHDLDDALSMLFLFASMPTTDKVSETVIANCDRLCREFENWVVRAHALRKVFLSIKGIYYRADVKGQEVTWLVPYRFSQQVPTDVDFRIMLTFLEFYQTFVGFVNYRLYTELGFIYPPKIDDALDDQAGGLASLTTERIGLTADDTHSAPRKTAKQIASLNVAAITQSERNEVENDADEARSVEDEALVDGDIDDFDTSAPRPATENGTKQSISLPSAATTSSTLFSGLTVYLSREVPRYSLEFVLRCFGAHVCWDFTLGGGSPLKEDDPAITHHICDRPRQDRRFQGRAYAQPQWVYDSINRNQLQPLDAYAPGAVLPPHLSPFVRLLDGQYDPTQAIAPAGEDSESEGEDVDEAADDEVMAEQVNKSIDASSAVATSEEVLAAAEDADLELEDESDPEEIERAAEQAELEAEASGVAFSDNTKRSSKKSASTGPATGSKARKTGKSKAKTEEERAARRQAEELALRKGMMSNKNKRLYDRMTYAKRQREDEAAELRKRRKALVKKQGSK
ncbi:mRNA-binding ribosome synthesis protein nop7 [Savitreella phatthalungensis]